MLNDSPDSGGIELDEQQRELLDSYGHELNDSGLLSRISIFDQNRIDAYIGLAMAITGEASDIQKKNTSELFARLQHDFTAIIHSISEVAKSKQQAVEMAVTVFSGDEEDRAKIIDAEFDIPVCDKTDPDWLRIKFAELFDMSTQELGAYFAEQYHISLRQTMKHIQVELDEESSQ